MSRVQALFLLILFPTHFRCSLCRSLGEVKHSSHEVPTLHFATPVLGKLAIRYLYICIATSVGTTEFRISCNSRNEFWWILFHWFISRCTKWIIVWCCMKVPVWRQCSYELYLCLLVLVHSLHRKQIAGPTFILRFESPLDLKCSDWMPRPQIGTVTCRCFHRLCSVQAGPELWSVHNFWFAHSSSSLYIKKMT